MGRDRLSAGSTWQALTEDSIATSLHNKPGRIVALASDVLGGGFASWSLAWIVGA